MVSVDRLLRPTETSIAYSIEPPQPNVLNIDIRCATIRQLRLTTNSVLDGVSLVVETMHAFAPVEQSSNSKDTKSLQDFQDGEEVPPSEFELNGTGRAG